MKLSASRRAIAAAALGSLVVGSGCRILKDEFFISKAPVPSPVAPEAPAGEAPRTVVASGDASVDGDAST
jgi:hypothetical protein